MAEAVQASQQATDRPEESNAGKSYCFLFAKAAAAKEGVHGLAAFPLERDQQRLKRLFRLVFESHLEGPWCRSASP
jgi:hypothetical protein